ncbi:MAG: HD domain-containing protein [Flavobacteriaceae bacterium]|nr:HD domain-containing protein [Flavobacteriaceae bacterium]
MKGYIQLRQKALEILNTKLSKKLYYHGVHHTLDVLNVCNQYLKRDNKISKYDAKILRLGALFHDMGFTVSNINHEERSAEIAEELMIAHQFSTKDIKVVKGLIMATRIPQSPKNKLEKIICDSDLDYLGRDDFYEISNELYKELKAYALIHNKKEWNIAQVKFLEAHSYHTPFAKKFRQPNKEKRIAELKKLIMKTENSLFG